MPKLRRSHWDLHLVQTLSPCLKCWVGSNRGAPNEARKGKTKGKHLLRVAAFWAAKTRGMQTLAKRHGTALPALQITPIPTEKIAGSVGKGVL